VSKVTLIVDPLTVDLDPQPIPAESILSGSPVARAKTVVTTHDWTSSIVVWDCTPGTFKWHYTKDESVYVLAGEAIMTTATGEERRMAAGDLAYYYRGFSCTWRVTQHFRKIAVLREPLWLPFGVALKVWSKLLRMTGLSGKSGL
jgi:uncharacterized protein